MTFEQNIQKLRDNKLEQLIFNENFTINLNNFKLLSSILFDNISLHSLYLYDIYLGNDIILILSKVLEVNKTLTRLTISNNFINNIIPLMEVLYCKNKTLINLGIHNNSGIDNNSIIAMGKMLKMNNNLQYLQINYNNINTEIIMNALKFNNTLTSLESYNNLNNNIPFEFNISLIKFNNNNYEITNERNDSYNKWIDTEEYKNTIKQINNEKNFNRKLPYLFMINNYRKYNKVIENELLIKYLLTNAYDDIITEIMKFI